MARTGIVQFLEMELRGDVAFFFGREGLFVLQGSCWRACSKATSILLVPSSIYEYLNVVVHRRDGGNEKVLLDVIVDQ